MALTREETGEYPDTRLFFVTHSAEDNEELFETLEDAREYIEATKFEGTPKISICIVRNSYKEDTGEWNYEDYWDTFQHLRDIV